MILWYPLEETDFTLDANDMTGGNHPGTCAVGSCPGSTAMGRVGRAAAFDATSDRLRTLSAAALQTPAQLTIAAFVNPDTLAMNQSIVGKVTNASTTANSWALEFPGGL